MEDDGGNAGNGVGTDQFPNYEEDEATFAHFLREHRILTRASANDDDGDDDSVNDDDDDALLVPTAPGGQSLRRIPCYSPLLRRIKDRHYYPSQPKTFVVEVPLSELVAWDAIRGGDLVRRTMRNTVRYRELFCGVIDSILDEMHATTTSAGGGGGTRRRNGESVAAGQRDSVDVLAEQRIVQREAAERRRRERLAQLAADGGNPDAAEGGLEAEAAARRAADPGGATEDFPPLLMRRYELRILPPGRVGTYPPFSKQQQQQGSEPIKTTDKGYGSDDRLLGPIGVSLRRIRARSVGRLVTVRGMIVRASDVKPACVVSTYSCDACGCEIYQVVSNKREFMPPKSCPSAECAGGPRGGGRGGGAGAVETLHMQTRGSKFVKFQELKLQELPNQVPMGHVPRSMSVHCRGELTRIACPGDVVTIDGVFLPQRPADGGGGGYRAMKAGLVSTTYLDAQNVFVHKKSFDESSYETMSESERASLDASIMSVATGPDPVGALSSAIAPEIYGHDDIKRSLLLQLVGGCTRKLPDGMRIRGDINICLMGDPGVAKSQLLKHVASIAPRGVYTTGKGSSGVGLTAAVTRDVTTGEMALEGGALVLADRGVCAIDEFDKMDESDRTAIHEVMEQQTVSVAKAGIVATLNARAAVLAAANPLYGRYNRHKSLSENVNLPNSLLSRFDLMFLILDVADVDRDMALARHVTFVHQNEGLEDATDGVGRVGPAAGGRAPNPITDDEDDVDMDDADVIDDDNDARSGADAVAGEGGGDFKSTANAITSRILREYIARARQHQPVVPPDVAPYIVEAYVGLRMQDGRGGGAGGRGASPGDQTAMTARQLLSILRLGQALARLRFSDYVAREDVDEAIRLTHMSKASLTEQEYHGSGGGGAAFATGTGQKTVGGGRAGGVGGFGGTGARGPGGEDVTSRIFHILKDYATASRSARVELKLCEAMVLRKGFTAQHLQACLEEYSALDVIEMNATGTHIVFVGS